MNILKVLRPVAILEGISFLVILGITMPLKYYFNHPEFSYPVGMAHGVLFIAYIVLVMMAKFEKKWSFGTTLICLIASLIPFGTFYVDKKYLKG